MFDIISIGDTTVDMFLHLNEANVACDINKEHCRLCFSYADKVPVESIVKIPGVGNAANNAVGSARLGLKAALYTIVGGDEDGRACKDVLKKEKVSSLYVKTDKKSRTNYSTVLNFQGERTILVYHEERKYRLPPLAKAGLVYFTSMGHGSEKIHSALLSYVRKNDVKLAFNPGTFQMKLGLAGLLPVFKQCEVLFLNKEEAERILGHDDDVKSLLAELHAKGPRLVVITDGTNGSYAYDGKTAYFCPIFDAPVVERTGAGDSYATAFVAALVSGQTISEAMRWGTFNSASVIQYVGAQAGLLTKREIIKLANKHNDFQPKQI